MHHQIGVAPVLAKEDVIKKRHFEMTKQYSQGFGSQEVTDSHKECGKGRFGVRFQQSQWSKEKDLVRLVLNTVMLAVSIIALSACANRPLATQPKESAIKIESVRLTAAGQFVDLRYRVLDAEVASQYIGPGVKPLLIDDATGAVLTVPTTAKLGALRQTRGVQKPDHLYFILFLNSAGLRHGNLVTAEIGEMRFENLAVE